MAMYWGWGQWDWTRAEASFRRALELDPNLARTRAFYSHFLNIQARPEEAMVQIERALELDPLNSFIRGLYGVDLMYARRYDEAIRELEATLEASPGLPIALNSLPDAYYLKGDLEESYRAQRQMFQARGLTEALDALDEGYRLGGYQLAMRRAAGVRVQSGVRAVPLLVKAGEIEKAIELFERMYASHDPVMPYIGNPIFADAMRGNPRYDALVKRMNLPTGSSEAK